MNRYYVKLNYTTTLDGSVLTLTCENEMSNINTTDEEILNVTCHSKGSWIPNPADFIKSCSPFTTVSLVPGTDFLHSLDNNQIHCVHVQRVYY